jgi:hypothetical protein
VSVVCVAGGGGAGVFNWGGDMTGGSGGGGEQPS